MKVKTKKCAVCGGKVTKDPKVWSKHSELKAVYVGDPTRAVRKKGNPKEILLGKKFLVCMKCVLDMSGEEILKKARKRGGKEPLVV